MVTNLLQNNKRIVIIGFKGFSDNPRGIERVILHQIEALKKSYNYFYVLHFGKVKIKKRDNIVLIGIGNNYLSLNIFLIIRLYIFFKFKNKTTICAHNSILGYIFGADYAYIHDLVKVQAGNSLAKIFLGFVEKLYLKKVPKIITISSTRKKYLVKNAGVPIEKIKVIKNTVSFLNDEHEKQPVNRDEFLNILSVRSLECRANLFWYVSFLKELMNISEYKINATIVGDGPLFNPLNEFIHRNELQDKIKLAGYLSDNELVSYYKKCFAVIVPSKENEGFGLPVIEGYYFDKPVFVNNIDALPEIVLSPYYILSNDIYLAANKVADFIDRNKNPNGYREYFDRHFSFNQYQKSICKEFCIKDY